MTTALAPAPTTRSRLDASDDVHPELDAAARRWMAQGETPETVAAYAVALRKLIGDL
jgi:hypothetical protein